MIKGSCLCGGVTYEIDADPTRAYNCHCSRCRKARGAAFASNVFFPIDSLQFTKGEDLVASYKVPDALRFTNVFCRVCGSCLPFRNHARGAVLVPMGSLDGDPDCKIESHIFVGSKAPWYEIGDDLPQFEEYAAS